MAQKRKKDHVLRRYSRANLDAHTGNSINAFVGRLVTHGYISADDGCDTIELEVYKQNRSTVGWDYVIGLPGRGRLKIGPCYVYAHYSYFAKDGNEPFKFSRKIETLTLKIDKDNQFELQVRKAEAKDD